MIEYAIARLSRCGWHDQPTYGFCWRASLLQQSIRRFLGAKKLHYFHD